MPAAFVFFIIFLIITIGFIVWRYTNRRNALNAQARLTAAMAANPGQRYAEPPKAVPYTGWGVAALGVITALLFIAAITTQIGTKEEGILTTFGKTSGHLSNGLHVIAPWEKVHEMDAAIQTDSYVGGDCLNVRIANQQTGCASVSIQWRIFPPAVDELYKDYRSFNHVRDALVTRRLTAAVNEAFAHFNPLDSIVNGAGGGVAASGSTSQLTLTQIAANISKILKLDVCPDPTHGNCRIEVLSTILPLITFDQATQDRINQLQQQVALTRVAEQQKITNTKQAEANAALAKSVNNSPNVLVSRCFDALEKMIQLGQAVPAGFSCWPGNGVAAVIAGGK